MSENELLTVHQDQKTNGVMSENEVLTGTAQTTKIKKRTGS